MLKTFTANIKRHSLSLSVLLHLLLLCFFVTVWLHPLRPPEKSPEVYIPSYLYKPTTAYNESSSEPRASSKPILKETPTAKTGLLTEQNQRSVISSAQEQRARLSESASTKETEPVHLIGDKKVDQPLIKLLGKAIFKHLVFPKIAIDFNIRGISSVGFTVHPDGYISDATIVQSSGASVLDDAALLAINQISPVKDVNQYIKEPTYLVANIIFK